MATSLPRSLVACGDSFTEGMDDDLGPDGRHRGWADRVAAGLALATGGVRYANLAVRGRVLDQVVDEQLTMAISLRPELATFHAGGNDLLRAGVDVASIATRYDAAVAQLSAASGQVLLFTVIERAGGTGRTADRLASRFAAFNAIVRETAGRQGCLLADMAAVPALQDRRLFAEDRLHLSAEGHARVAAAVLELLGVTDPHLLGGRAGWWQEPLPSTGRPPRRHDVAADVRWVRRHLLPWMWRRLVRRSSGDIVRAKHAGLVDVVPASQAER